MSKYLRSIVVSIQSMSNWFSSPLLPEVFSAEQIELTPCLSSTEYLSLLIPNLIERLNNKESLTTIIAEVGENWEIIAPQILSSITSLTILNDKDLEELFKFIPHIAMLNSLTIRDCTNWNELPNIPSLKFLCITNCSIKILPVIDDLETLILFDCPVTKIPTFPKLTYLGLFFCYRLIDLSSFPNLKDVHINGCHGLKKEAISQDIGDLVETGMLESYLPGGILLRFPLIKPASKYYYPIS